MGDIINTEETPEAIRDENVSLMFELIDNNSEDI